VGEQDQSDCVVEASPIFVELLPYGMWRYSGEFLRACVGFEPENGGFTPVPYYLVCRSIELVLKAFLLSRFVSKDVLKRRVGHDLEKALIRADERGLGGLVELDSLDRVSIGEANRFYASKDFEYFETARWMDACFDPPDMDRLKSVAERLLVATETACLGYPDEKVRGTAAS